jgi:hypothetical protein
MSQQCQKYRALLSGFMDRELEDVLCAEIQEHIDKCPDCRNELKLLQITVLSIRNLENPPAPAHFLSSLRQRIEHETTAPAAGFWRGTTRWLMGHPALLAASFSMIFVFAFLLGRFSPTPQIAKTTSEMEPARALHLAQPLPAAYMARANAQDKTEAKDDGIEFIAMAPPAAPARTETRSLAAPVSFGELESAPAEPVASRPLTRIELQTPTQLVISIVRNDPSFQGAAIYPIRQGAVVQTKDSVCRITISDANFLEALHIIAKERSLPPSVEQAQKILKLDLEKLPSPLLPQ